MDVSCLGLQQAMLSAIHWFITRKAAIMSNMAYEEIYFDSMIQKTRYLFKLIARNTKEPFQVITEYMCST